MHMHTHAHAHTHAHTRVRTQTHNVQHLPACSRARRMQDSMVDSLLQFAMTYRDRVRKDLIQPAVDWRAKTGQAAAAVAK